MSQRDPVHAVELVAYLMSKVGELTRARPTDLTFEKLSSTIPPQALQFLKSLPHQNTTATKKSPKKKSSWKRRQKNAIKLSIDDSVSNTEMYRAFQFIEKQPFFASGIDEREVALEPRPRSVTIYC